MRGDLQNGITKHENYNMRLESSFTNVGSGDTETGARSAKDLKKEKEQLERKEAREAAKMALIRYRRLKNEM